MTEAETFTTACGWCRRKVISFAAPPAMVEVTSMPDGEQRQSVDHICLYCYAEHVKFVANRANEAGNPNGA